MKPALYRDDHSNQGCANFNLPNFQVHQLPHSYPKNRKTSTIANELSKKSSGFWIIPRWPQHA